MQPTPRVTLGAVAAQLKQAVAARRITVYDAEHRALVARYGCLPLSERRVVLPNHLDACHALRGRTCFASPAYEAGKTK